MSQETDGAAAPASARPEAPSRASLCGLLGSSRAMQGLYDQIERAAATETTVFVTGESGTGKELVAAAIHALGQRRQGPLVRVNVTALHGSLFESELFGHARGSFTGAVRERVGRFEAASGGTIFLDEIGDLPLAAQVKLLRVLQERQIERVGETAPVPVDVRVISATHKQVGDLVRSGQFRADLYYRLHVFPIRIPPLRERLEDTPTIARSVLGKLCERYGRGPVELAREAEDALVAYDWPGNVRELENAVEFAYVRATSEVVLASDLPPEVLRGPQRPGETSQTKGNAGIEVDGPAILQALRDAQGCRSLVARRLGISRTTLWRRLKQLERSGALAEDAPRDELAAPRIAFPPSAPGAAPAADAA